MKAILLVCVGTLSIPALAETISLGSGNDIVYVGDLYECVGGVCTNEGAHKYVNGTVDPLPLSNNESLLIIGSSGADHLEIVNSVDGNKFISLGVSLRPITSVILGPTVIEGGPGQDVIRGSNKGDYISGGTEDDDIHGNGGPDNIVGKEFDCDVFSCPNNCMEFANDTCEGNDGSDAIICYDLADGGSHGTGSDECRGFLTPNCEFTADCGEFGGL